MSIEIVPLAVLLPQLWIALLLIIGLAVWRQQTSNPTAPIALRHAVALIPLPVVMLIWALHFWPSDLAARAAHETVALLGLHAFAIAEVCVAAWIVTRPRRRISIMAAIACAALLWTAGVEFVGSMAITNTWL